MLLKLLIFSHGSHATGLVSLNSYVVLLFLKRGNSEEEEKGICRQHVMFCAKRKLHSFLLGSLHALKIFCAKHREEEIFFATHREEVDIYSSYLLSQINKPPCGGFFAILHSTMFTTFAPFML